MKYKAKWIVELDDNVKIEKLKKVKNYKKDGCYFGGLYFSFKHKILWFYANINMMIFYYKKFIEFLRSKDYVNRCAL